jgi:hypothetical protein
LPVARETEPQLPGSRRVSPGVEAEDGLLLLRLGLAVSWVAGTGRDASAGGQSGRMMDAKYPFLVR